MLLTNPHDVLHHGKHAANNKVDALCDRPKLTTLHVECCQFSVTAPASNLPHLHLAPPLGMTPFEFCRDFQQQKTTVSGLSCSIVCAIVRLVISVEQTDGSMDGETDTWRQPITALASIVQVKTYTGHTAPSVPLICLLGLPLLDLGCNTTGWLSSDSRPGWTVTGWPIIGTDSLLFLACRSSISKSP